MEALLIQLTHQKARNLLLDLESMNIIKLIKPESSEVPNSRRLREKLSDKTAEALQAFRRRQEWEEI